MKKKDLYSGITFLILAQVMVGLNIVISKLLLTSMPTLWLLEIRFTLAAISLLPLHWVTPARKYSIHHYYTSLSKKDCSFLLLQALTAGVLFNCLMLTGLHYSDANAAGIITSVLPAIIAILSWLILKESFSIQTSFCILFATAGLMAIAFDKYRGTHISQSIQGDLIILLSLLPEATYYILCKLSPNRLPVFLVSAFMNAINALLLIPIVFFTPWQDMHFSMQNLLVLIFTGITSGLFYIFWFTGAQRVDGIMASLSTATMPVATVIFSYFILSEYITLLQAMGMALVILSILIYSKR